VSGFINLKNRYDNNDTTIVAIQDALDISFSGHNSVEILNYYTPDSPPILTDGAIEVIGDLYEWSTGPVSTTDPVTALPVADGKVYIVISASDPSPGFAAAYLTATTPTWNKTHNGWDVGLRRALPWVIDKSGATYSNVRDIYRRQLDSETFSVSDATERTQAASGENVIPSMTLNITIPSHNLNGDTGKWMIFFTGKFRNSGSVMSVLYLKSSGGTLSSGVGPIGAYYGTSVPGYAVQSNIYPDGPIMMTYLFSGPPGSYTIDPYWYQATASTKYSKELRIFAYRLT
jgi:hypothetical protein